jgi:pimeloyl-ACP methyl ester carboxylesterase
MDQLDWQPPQSSPSRDNPLVFELIDGRPTRGRKGWGNVDGYDIAFWVVVIEYPDRFYVAKTWTLASWEETHLPELQEIVRSFERLTPPTSELQSYPNLTVVPQEEESVLETRRQTATVVHNTMWAPFPADPPSAVEFELIRYTSPAGELAAYLTADPGDGEQHPAILWSHSGFGGINGWLLDEKALELNDQTVLPFARAGLVVMAPSWRGENDNPGRYELFYTEAEDLLAARDHLAGLPYVDPERIYLAGHSTGGTMTLLAAASTDKFRAAFSLGGDPILSAEHAYPEAPFEVSSPREHELRSPARFVSQISRPTFYFEGEYTYQYNYEALRRQRRR